LIHPTPLPLMIVDDDDDLRNALTFIMSAHGYEVAAFGDARRALGALETSPPPFLILLDLMMAGMSGWEFRAAQLADVKLSPIPVVILTAAHTLTDGVHTLSDVEIVEKPFALDALLDIVARYAIARPGPSTRAPGPATGD
jgi:CheY-like chemotaxis protein